MSTSLFKGLVRYQDSLWDDYAPVDTAQSRAVLSNVMHSADSCGQVLVNWRVADARSASRVLTQASTYYAVWTSAALPIRFNGDGSAYKIRLRLRAAAGVAGTVDFAVCVIGGNQSVDAAYDAIPVGAPVAATASSSSTSHAWLTLSTPTINLVSGSEAISGITRNTYAEIGGAAVGVSYDAAKIVIMAQRSTGSGSTTSALISGLHAAEYIGV